MQRSGNLKCGGSERGLQARIPEPDSGAWPLAVEELKAQESPYPRGVFQTPRATLALTGGMAAGRPEQ